MRRYWTTSERRKAVELRREGLSYDKIAYFIDRSPDAIAAHLRALRLSEAKDHPAIVVEAA